MSPQEAKSRYPDAPVISPVEGESDASARIVSAARVSAVLILTGTLPLRGPLQLSAGKYRYLKIFGDATLTRSAAEGYLAGDPYFAATLQLSDYPDGVEVNGIRIVHDADFMVANAWQNPTPVHGLAIYRCGMTPRRRIGGGPLAVEQCEGGSTGFGVRVVNCSFDGIGLPTTSGHRHPVALLLRGNGHVEVDACHFRDCFGAGTVTISDVNGDVRLSRLMIENAGSEAVNIGGRIGTPDDPVTVLVEDCTIRKAARHGIAIGYEPAGAGPVNPIYGEVIVDACTISDTGWSGVYSHEGNPFDARGSVLIRNCRLMDCGIADVNGTPNVGLQGGIALHHSQKRILIRNVTIASAEERTVPCVLINQASNVSVDGLVTTGRTAVRINGNCSNMRIGNVAGTVEAQWTGDGRAMVFDQIDGNCDVSWYGADHHWPVQGDVVANGVRQFTRPPDMQGVKWSESR
ncbi:MAG: right-handed parallel beta-helix repeat-containing protein [Tepidisphaeraceae bacterium]